jgi:pantoate--beta-alanine ligase
MQQIKSPKKLQALTSSIKQKGKTIAVVPTMGALHEGHLSLIKLAQKKADIVILTIFVNPLQFGKNEDFSTYPRTLKEDLEKAKKLKVDFVFTPKASDLYLVDFQTTVQVGDLTNQLCGQSRPGHFDGVCTIVLKLFMLTRADIGVFGKKDYQQYLVIKKMVEDLNLPIKIIGAPISREKSGLARSSRNKNLTQAELNQALILSQSIKQARKELINGKKIYLIKRNIQNKIKTIKNAKVDYVEILDANSLLPIKNYQKSKTLIALAVFIGSTRLIDNQVV